jgi:uncharacterized protein YndB with AHSA1/START domain
MSFTIAMEQQSVIHNTFVVERSYPVAPEKVFSALADPEKKRRWFAHGPSHEIEEFAMDFRVGGEERTRYRFKEGTPFPDVLLSTAGAIQDIVPDRRVVIASTMTLGERRISSALVTFELLKTDRGTDLILTHQAAFYEGADGPAMRQDGWRRLLDSLAAELAR